MMAQRDAGGGRFEASLAAARAAAPEINPDEYGPIVWPGNDGEQLMVVGVPKGTTAPVLVVWDDEVEQVAHIPLSGSRLMRLLCAELTRMHDELKEIEDEPPAAA